MYRALSGRRELGLKRWLAALQYLQQAFWNLSAGLQHQLGSGLWGAASPLPTQHRQSMEGCQMCHLFWEEGLDGVYKEHCGKHWCSEIREGWMNGRRGLRSFHLQDTSVPEDLYTLPHLISRILQGRDYQLCLIDEENCSRLKFRQLVCAEVRTWTQVCLAPNQVSSPLIVPPPTGTQEEPALRTWTGLWVLMLQQKGCELKGESQDGTQDL